MRRVTPFASLALLALPLAAQPHKVTQAEVDRITRDAILIDTHNDVTSRTVEGYLRVLRDYYALGVRYMTLTHSNTNTCADSQGDADNPKVAHHNGLTPFGKDVVREMNRLGMMVDISHTADKTFWDALETSSAPIIASHSGCRAVSSYTRNMTDEMIKALASNGGVMQINFGCDFLSQRYFDDAKPLQASMRDQYMAALKIEDPAAKAAAIEKLRAEFTSKVPPATLADVVAQIDHAVQ